MGALSYYENKPLPEIGILALFYLFYFYNLYPILCIFHMFGGLFQALWNDQHLTSISRRGCDEREDSVALSWPVHIAGCENLRSLQEGVRGQGSRWEERVETETLRPLLHPFHSANAKPHPFVRAGIQKRLETWKWDEGLESGLSLPNSPFYWGGGGRGVAGWGGARGAVKGLKRSRYLVLLTYNSPRMGEWVGVLRHPGKCMCSQAMVRIGLMKKLKKRTLATTPGAE